MMKIRTCVLKSSRNVSNLGTVHEEMFIRCLISSRCHSDQVICVIHLCVDITRNHNGQRLGTICNNTGIIFILKKKKIM